jgi:hypothetical protein
MLHAWTTNMLQLLDNHFAEQPYLLGMPTMADFALAGPFVAHLGRDPWPRDNLVSGHPHLQDWIHRMATVSYQDIEGAAANSPHSPLAQGFASDDIPVTLTPILAAICSEFVPMLQGISDQVTALKSTDKFRHGGALPRTLADVHFPLGDATFARRGSPFSLWKIQLLLDGCASMSSEHKNDLAAWMSAQPFPAEQVLQLQFPRVRRNALTVAFDE